MARGRGGRGGATRGRKPAGRGALTRRGSSASATEEAFSADLPQKRRRGADEDVTLMYQRPARRGRHAASGAGDDGGASAMAPPPSVRGPRPHLSHGAPTSTAAVHASAAGGAPRLSLPAQKAAGTSGADVLSDMAMWRRCSSQRNLIHALENCGLAPSSGPNASLVASLFTLDEDRIRTAVQCLVDLKALAIHVPLDQPLTPVVAAEAAKAVSGGTGAVIRGGWWVRTEYARACVSLANTCDAAVRTVFPSLAQQRGTQGCPDEPGSSRFLLAPPRGDDTTSAAKTAVREDGAGSVEVVPLPVAMSAVQERLRCLKRIWQLRFMYGLVMPALQRCSSLADLNHLFLSGHGPEGSGREAGERRRTKEDMFVPSFPSSPSNRHRAETLVLNELVRRANESGAIDSETWGPLAVLPALRATQATYILQHESRERALSELLDEEADLYGLPPFLRSIRCTGHTGAYGQEGHARASSLAADVAKEHLLFPSLCSLPPDRFQRPDAMQHPLVQEELIGLALKHCAFGFVVGEADQVVFMLKEWGEHRAEAAARAAAAAAAAHPRDGTGKKSEGADSDGAALEGEAVKQERGTNAGGAGSGCPSAAAPPGTVPAAGRGGVRRRDPFAPFVRETAVRARELRQGGGSTPSAAAPNSSEEGVGSWGRFCTAHWLSTNPWRPAGTGATYYGVVYGVVMQSDLFAALDGATPSVPIDADGGTDGSDGTPRRSTSTSEQGSDASFKEASYYLAAVVELTR